MIKCLGKACLFFTANRFARLLTKMAEESFFKIGLSPTEAFALMILNEEGAMGSSKLGQRLHLSPSTVTRFIDKLILKGYCIRTFEGKNSKLTLSPNGIKIQADIKKCWSELYQEYSMRLGDDESSELSLKLYEYGDKLEEKYKLEE